MAKSRATHAQAQLQLQLYDLRREEKLRKARDWFAANFWVDKPEDMQAIAPQGSEENAYMRMVVSYWEQACILFNQGLLNEEQFFTSSGEFFMVWERLKPVAAQMRQQFKNPYFFANLEKAAKRFEKWSERRAPGSRAIMREFMRQGREAARQTEAAD